MLMRYSPHAINPFFENELPNYCKDCVKLYYVKKEQNGLYTSAFYETKVFAVKLRHLQKNM